MDSSEKVEKSKLMTWLVFAIVAIVPAVFATGFTRFASLKIVVGFVFISLMAVLWGIPILRNTQRVWKGWKVGILLLSLSTFALLSLLWSPSAVYGLEHAMLLLSVGVIPVVISTLKEGELPGEDLGLAIAIGVLLSSGMCFADAFGVSIFSQIWDAPGYTGAFDGAFQGSAFLGLATFALLAFSRVASSWKLNLIRISIVAGALALGHLGNIPLFIGIGISLMLLAVLGRKHSSMSFVAILGIFVGALLIGQFVIPSKSSMEVSVANRLPTVFEPEITSVEQIKSTRLENALFDIDRLAAVDSSVDIVNNFSILSEVPGNIVLGFGAGSWWLHQSPIANEIRFENKIDKFRFYPVFRSGHHVNAFSFLFEFGVVGAFFLFFVLLLLVGMGKNKDIEGDWVVVAIFAILMIVSAFDIPSVVLLGSVILGYVLSQSENDTLILNDPSNVGLTKIFAICIILGGISFAGFSGFSGVSRYQESHGDLLMLRKKTSAAKEAYANAFQFSKSAPSLAYNYALSLYSLGEYKEAVEPIQRANALRPYDARYLYLLAQIQFKNGEITKATKSTREAIALFPYYIEARKLLAVMLDMMGNRIKGNAELVMLVELPDLPANVARGVHRQLGESFSVLSQPIKARDHFKAALAGERDSVAKRSLSIRISQIEAKIEEDRLLREGKGIPEALKKKLKGMDHKHKHKH